MDERIQIQGYGGDFEDLMELLKMSIGTDSSVGARKLIEIEQARGTCYYTANLGQQIVGMIGLFYDATGSLDGLEPPQIIDLAVVPEMRGQGVGRALVQFAIGQVRDAGLPYLWLYTDGNESELLTFYRRLGFWLVSVTPDWFGKGTVKAVFRMDF